ncbi:MAG: hypothetical protein H6658_16370 [Ardenticatenaceae bacterium]|nr:hypothetical protein [Ardenticatenaceae bacterium]
MDGEPTPIFRANGIFRAVVLPATTADQPHEVTFVYDPTSVRGGLAVTGVALLTAVVLVGVGLVQDRRLGV